MRALEVGMSVPVLLNHRVSQSNSAWGGGAGDARLFVIWDPAIEVGRAGDKPVLPVPVFTLGVRLPTGRGYADASGTLLEDVTGVGRPALLLGAQLERTVDRWPWAIGLYTDLGLGTDSVQPVVNANASLGRYITQRWSVMASIRATAAWADASRVDTASARTVLGARVVYGKVQAWRAYAGVEADLAAPFLGRSSNTYVSFGVGVVWVL